jgi:hypothetical protein
MCYCAANSIKLGRPLFNLPVQPQKYRITAVFYKDCLLLPPKWIALQHLVTGTLLSKTARSGLTGLFFCSTSGYLYIFMVFTYIDLQLVYEE